MYRETLLVHRQNCPSPCDLCLQACAQRRKGEGKKVIWKIDLAEREFHRVLPCNQCSQPECERVCPTGALDLNAAEILSVDRDRCVGCGLCTLACPYGGITLHAELKMADKCDLCQGEPLCAAACPYGILELKRAKPLLEPLQEDVLSPGIPFCAGCLMENLVRFTLQVLGEKVILFGAPSCGVLGERCRVPYYGCLMTNVPSSMTGVKRFLDRQKREATCVAIVGDGTTADIGFQVLSAAAERGEKLLYICYDNEAYMNTGIQRSSTTPLKSWTTTTQVGPKGRGKGRAPKNVPLLMAFHEIPYAATATFAFLEDYADKLRKAQAACTRGLAYLHVLCPCPTGWRSAPEDAIELSRKAVETNYFPLWEAEFGKIRLTHEEHHPRPIQTFANLMGRFSHLSPDELQEFQDFVNRRYEKIRHLSRIP